MTDKIVSKLQLVRCYLFLYFACDVGVLETRLVNRRLLLDQGGDSLTQSVVLLLCLLSMRWPLTVRVALDFLGHSAVCERWSSVDLTMLMTVSAIGGTKREFEGARAAGGDGSHGGSSTSIIAGSGVFRRVCR